MEITCWGSRGSIAVSGKEFNKYGGDTTCLEIRANDGELIIVDAGSGIRNLGKKLIAEKTANINLVFTHAHWDHLLGFPFFKPLYVESTSLQLYGCPFAQTSIREMLQKSMSPPYFPVQLEDLKADISYHGACSGAFHIGPIEVTPILLSHPNQGIGYKFSEDGKSFVFLTDNELTYKHPGGLDYQEYADFCTGADLLFHDAEFTSEEYAVTRTWGHTVYNDALRLALDANVKSFGLFHHNQDRTDDALDSIMKDCTKIIEKNGTNLNCFAVSAGMQLSG